MEGITILSQNVVTKVDPQADNAISIIFTVAVSLLVISILTVVIGTILDHPVVMGFGAIILIISFIGLITGTVVSICAPRVPDYTEYKVTIDDTVSYKDFTEKYEIIEQDNLIFTVKEKD